MLDAHEYDGLASALLAGRWLLDLETAYVHGLLYPVLLAACKGLGIGLVGARLLQAVMGAACCWLIHRIGRRCASPAAGLAAGLLAAVYWPFILFGGELLATTLVLLLELVLVEALLAAGHGSGDGPAAKGGARSSPWPAVTAGALLGLLAMTRANAILLAPAAAWWVWRRQGSRRLAQMALAMVLALSPYLARNQIVQGSPVPFQGGWSFYQGANPGADGTPYVRQGAEWQRLELQAVRAGAVDPAQRGAYYTDQALRFIASEPGRWLELLYRKLRLFWHRHEVPVSADLRTIEAGSPLHPFLPGMGVVVPLALAGLVLGGGLRRPEHRLLAGCILVWLASCLLFTVSARYRLPAAPFLILFAGIGAEGLCRAAAGRRFRRLAAGAALLAAGAAAAHTGVDARAVDHLRSEWLLGHLHMRRGDYPAAEAALTAALVRDPGSPDAHNSLGVVHEHLGRPVEAERSYRRALERDPRYARAWLNLGRLLLRRERLAESSSAFARALEIDPREAVQHEGWYHLGHLALVRRDPARAWRAFTRALEARPSAAAAWYGKSVAAAGLGRLEEQVRCLERAVEQDPALAPAQRNLGALYARAGLLEEAERALRAAAAAAPADALTRRHLGGLYERMGRPEEARRALEEADRLEAGGGPRPEVSPGR